MLKKTIFASLFLLSNLSIFAQIIYVRHTATNGQNNGTSWQNAYTELQDALNAATNGDTVWVSKGTYKPPTLTDRTISFDIPSGIALFGSFLGNETSLIERDIVANPTILSGDIGQVNNGSDNSYTIAHLYYEAGQTTIDGFTFQKGSAQAGSTFCIGPILECNGGGLFVEGGHNTSSASLTIVNCIFENNLAKRGAGLYLDASTGLFNLTIDDCVFHNNVNYEQATYLDAGGGIYITHAGDAIQEEFINITNSSFMNNHSTQRGGGIYYAQLIGDDIDTSLVEPRFTIDNCFFEGNYADGGMGGAGGAIYLQAKGNEGKIKIQNSTIQFNSAGHGFEGGSGAGISSITRLDKQGIVIDNCLFKQNSCHVAGGINYGGHLTILNSSFLENYGYSDIFFGGGGAVYGEGDLNLFNCVFAKNVTYNALGGGAFGTYPNDDLKGSTISNCIFYENKALNNGGVCWIYGEKTVFTNCVFWNNSSINTPNDNIYTYFDQDTIILKNNIWSTDSCSATIPADYTELILLCENNLFNIYPNFTDTLNNHFSLACNSIGIDNGTTVPAIFADISTDIAGHPRILGSTIDIGAHEYMGIFMDTIIQNTTSESNADGSILLENIMGGLSPFTFLWSTGDTTNHIQNLLAGDYEVTITDALNCSRVFEFTIDYPNAIPAILNQKGGITIYPNPTTNSVTLTFSNPTKASGTAQLFTLNGRKINAPQTFSERTTSLNISLADLPAGVYFLKIEMEEQVFYWKVMKQ